MNEVCAECGTPVRTRTVDTSTFDGEDSEEIADYCPNRECVNNNRAHHHFGWAISAEEYAELHS